MKTVLTRVGLAAALALLFASRAPAAESLSTLLQRGIYAEETEGNLDSAIKIYEQIAAEAAANRDLVAQAQFRLAVCFQKKGDKDQAIKLLDDLVRQTLGDTDSAKKARTTLTELGAPPTAGFSLRKVPLPFAKGWLMSVSADGRYVAYEPNGSNDVVVGEISTGRSWTVGKGAKGNDPWTNALISPDGQWIAYDLAGEIHLAKIDGTGDRVVHKYKFKDEDEWAETQCWSADSSQLLLALWTKGDQAEIVVGVDAKTGARNEIARPPKVSQETDVWAISPDGRYLARRRGNYPRTITLVDLESGLEETILDRDADQVVGWTSGDAKLLFSKSRGTDIDLYSVAVKNGKMSGVPDLVWGNVGNGSLRVARDNKIYYAPSTIDPAPSELWVMEGVLDRKAPTQKDIQIPPEELSVKDHSFLDRKFGLSVTYPATWKINDAARSGSQLQYNVVAFTVPHPQHAKVNVWYRPNPDFKKEPPSDEGDRQIIRAANVEVPNPKTTGEIDAWLRRFTELTFEHARTDPEDRELWFKGFKVRPEGLVLRTAGGHRVVSWTADYSDHGKTSVEIHATAYSEALIVDFRFTASTADAEALRSDFDQMVESFQLAEPGASGPKN